MESNEGTVLRVLKQAHMRVCNLDLPSPHQNGFILDTIEILYRLYRNVETYMLCTPHILVQ